MREHTAKQVGPRRWSIVAFVAACVTALIIVYLGYDLLRPRCDGIFEQTAVQIKSRIDDLQAKGVKVSGGLEIGREQVQALSDSAQQTAVHLKTCCIMQQAGSLGAKALQQCIDGANSYGQHVLQIVDLIGEARAAPSREEASQKLDQAQRSLPALNDAATRVTQAADTRLDRPAGSGQDGPHDTILNPVPIMLGTAIQGEVPEGGASTFYRFRYEDPKMRRDWLTVQLDNKSVTLQPAFTLYNADKSLTGLNNVANTAGADLKMSFVAASGTTYILEATSQYRRTAGKYELTVAPGRSYDQYEPNDQWATATPIEFGKTIEANIMDGSDVDWYRLRGAPARKVTVRVENRSPGLVPAINIYADDRSPIANVVAAGEGADVSLAFDAQDGKQYLLVVQSQYQRSSGPYRLTTQ